MEKLVDKQICATKNEVYEALGTLMKLIAI
jgi:hypothetical protein